jgi:hypothetical protein
MSTNNECDLNMVCPSFSLLGHDSLLFNFDFLDCVGVQAIGQSFDDVDFVGLESVDIFSSSDFEFGNFSVFLD